jgi:hypothetical protein
LEGSLSLLDFVPPALHAAIRAQQRADPVHEAVQRWLDALAESGRPGHIPAGRYGIGATVGWAKEGDSQGPMLTGEGGRTSVFAPADFPGGGPLFRFDGSSRRPYKHALHMHLRDFGIVAERDATAAGTVGIELIGMLYADIERLFIARLSGDGLSIPARPEIHANPDAYTTQVTLRSVYIDGCGGWALRSTAGLGLNLKLDDPYFVRNRAGGVSQGGGLFYCERGTISFNGSAAAAEQYARDPASGSRYGGGGIHIAWLGGAAIGPRVVQTELETNYGYNLWCEAAGGLVTQQIKSNSSTVAFGGGELRPPAHFRFGHGRGIVINYTSINDAFRGKAFDDEPDTPLLAYEWDATQISDHLLINPYFAGWAHAGAARYSDTRAAQRVTIIEENRPVRSTPEAAIARIAAAVAIPRGDTLLPFAAEEFDPHNLFDSAATAFRAASAGLYQLSAMVHVQAPEAGAVRLVAAVNGAPAAIAERSVAAGEGSTVEMHTLLALAAGDQLTMRLAHDLAGEVTVRPGAGYGRLAVSKQG